MCWNGAQYWQSDLLRTCKVKFKKQRSWIFSLSPLCGHHHLAIYVDFWILLILSEGLFIFGEKTNMMPNLRKVDILPELKTHICDCLCHLLEVKVDIWFCDLVLSPVGWSLVEAGQLEETGRGHWYSPSSPPKHQQLRRCSSLFLDVHHDHNESINSIFKIFCSMFSMILSLGYLPPSYSIGPLNPATIERSGSMMVSNNKQYLSLINYCKT